MGKLLTRHNNATIVIPDKPFVCREHFVVGKDSEVEITKVLDFGYYDLVEEPPLNRQRQITGLTLNDAGDFRTIIEKLGGEQVASIRMAVIWELLKLQKRGHRDGILHYHTGSNIFLVFDEKGKLGGISCYRVIREGRSRANSACSDWVIRCTDDRGSWQKGSLIFIDTTPQ